MVTKAGLGAHNANNTKSREEFSLALTSDIPTLDQTQNTIGIILKNVV